MEKDKQWVKFFEDNVRYSDVINGIGCNGAQVIRPHDLTELDTKTNGKYRDMLRKAAFGVGFAIIGIENQETIDYSIPIRIMEYDIESYRKQKSKLVKRNRKKIKQKKIKSSQLEKGEFLYGFLKTDRVYPTVTFILYAGKERWTGPKCLHDVIDFQDVPESIQKLVENYHIHIVDIRRIEDTAVFKTDVKQVFDFLKCTEDMQALLDLVEKEVYYKSMDIDAYEVVKSYANISNVIQVEKYKGKEGIDVCKAIQDLMADSREKGILEGKEAGIKEGLQEGIQKGIKEGQTDIILNMLKQDLPIEKICLFTGCSKAFVKEVKKVQ